MKKILCPVDGSNTANNAVEYAAKMAKDIKAELVLMEIVSAAGLQEISNHYWMNIVNWLNPTFP